MIASLPNKGELAFYLGTGEGNRAMNETIDKDEAVKRESIYVYQLQKLGDSILNELHKAETGKSPDASFAVLKARLLDLSVKLNPIGEDILKTLAHQLTELGPNRKATIEYMRGLVHELFHSYQTGKVIFVVPEEEAGAKTHRQDFVGQRMNQARLVHDLKKLTKERSPKKRKCER